MNAATTPRKSIRRPVSLVSAAAGEPPIQVTPRQITIGKMIGAAVGGVPVAILLLAFHVSTGPAYRPQVVAAQPEPGAEEVARAKAEATTHAKGGAGTILTSCTYTPSGAEIYRELSYRNGKVRESSATKCAAH